MPDHENRLPKRQSQMPFVLAFLRNNPNLGYSVQEIEKETGHSASGLSREAAKPGTQVVALPQKGYYMWTTTRQNVQKETDNPIDPTDFELVGKMQNGDSVYRDKESGSLYRLVFEKL